MASRLVLPGARRPAPVVRASVPKPPPPKPVPRPPEPPRPAAKAEPPREPGLPAGVAAFARLSALVPAGSWPATLPTTAEQPVRPLEAGVRQRVAALLPEGEHKELAKALREHCGSRRYHEALAADGAVRWSDGGEPAGPVSPEHRAHALRLLGRPVGDG